MDLVRDRLDELSITAKSGLPDHFLDLRTDDDDFLGLAASRRDLLPRDAEFGLLWPDFGG